MAHAQHEDPAGDHVYTVSDAAFAFGTSRQVAHRWITTGFHGIRLDALEFPGLRGRTQYRLSGVDMARFAAAAKKPIVGKLPPKGEMSPRRIHDDATLDILAEREESRDMAKAEYITEVKAAERLGMARSTLQKHRADGVLNPAITIRKQSPYKTSPFLYLADDVDRVAAGELELYSEPS